MSYDIFRVTDTEGTNRHYGDELRLVQQSVADIERRFALTREKGYESGRRSYLSRQR